MAESTADGGLEWHCRSFLYEKGTVRDGFEEDAETGWDDNMLSGANNHGAEIQRDTVDTSDLDDGTYTVASACFGGVGESENDADPVAAGTQDFTLGASAATAGPPLRRARSFSAAASRLRCTHTTSACSDPRDALR